VVNLTKNEIIDLLAEGKISEVKHGVELKRNWDKGHGEDISAIANHLQALCVIALGISRKSKYFKI